VVLNNLVLAVTRTAVPAKRHPVLFDILTSCVQQPRNEDDLDEAGVGNLDKNDMVPACVPRSCLARAAHAFRRPRPVHYESGFYHEENKRGEQVVTLSQTTMAPKRSVHRHRSPSPTFRSRHGSIEAGHSPGCHHPRGPSRQLIWPRGRTRLDVDIRLAHQGTYTAQNAS
jgi:hypothetical protein